MSRDLPALILSVNDLEAARIAERAKGKAQVIDLKAPWGARIPFGRADLDPGSLPNDVILVESPDPGYEDALRRAGKRLSVVDHHATVAPDGRLLDRRSPKSALEQVAALLGLDLDDDDRAIVANDVAFWPGLLRHFGGDVAKARGIRDRERALRARLGHAPGLSVDETRAWLDEATGTGAARYFATEGRPHDHGLWLIHAPDMHAATIGDALYENALARIDESRARAALVIDTLTLSGPEGAAPTSLSFSGGAHASALIDALIGEATAGTLDRWCGGGGETAYFGVTGGAEAVSALADRILNEALIGARPLRNWRSQFYDIRHLPGARAAAAKSSLAPKPNPPDGADYIAAHVRPYIRPETIEQARDTLSIATYDVSLQNYAIGVRWPTGREIIEPVVATRVHICYGDIVILEWATGAREKAEYTEDPDPPALWRRYLAGEGEGRTVADILDFNEAARNIYSPYVNDRERKSLFLKRGERISNETDHAGQITGADAVLLGWFGPLMRKMLDALKLEAAYARPMTDHRARVACALCPTGDAPRTAPGTARRDVLRSRLAMVDGYEETHFYDPPFALEELDRAAYNRFNNAGAFWHATEHSFTLLGYSGFAARYGVKDVTYNYGLMFMTAVFYAASLRRLWGRLTEEKALKGDANVIRKVREDYTIFANALWFDVISTQLQGRELFDLMRRQTPIRQEYAEFTCELERADALADSNHHRAEARGQRLLNMLVAGLGFGVGAHQVAWTFMATRIDGPLLALGVGLAIGAVALAATWILTKNRVGRRQCMTSQDRT